MGARIRVWNRRGTRGKVFAPSHTVSVRYHALKILEGVKVMGSELISGLDWWAILIGTALAFLLGWLWYSPKMFGAKWAEGVGVSLADGGEMPVLAMISQLVGTFLLAWVVGIMAIAGAYMTLALIVATIVVLMAAGGLFAKKSAYAIATETGFVIAMSLVMVVVQALL